MLAKLIDKIRHKGTQLSYVTYQLNNFKYILRRNYLEDKVLHSQEKGISTQMHCDHEVIVSLTTYGKRLQDVCFTVESLMQQTLKPNRIILNLDSSARKQLLPIALKNQLKRGLEIKIVDDNIRSYKKLIPTLKDNPEAIIITVDDDLLYEFDVIERLFNSYLTYPNKVSALRTHTILFDDNKTPLSYNKWKMECADTQNPYHLFATGVGGVLYPPHCLSDEVFNQDVFTSICPTADDVWFHAMALKNGTGIVKVPSRNSDGCDYILNESVQDMGLCTINTGDGGLNDPQIKAVYEKYGIYEILKK